ncbi:MAG: GAF domain-containing protein, partial [Dehalococcoidia bacterium]|nr:GAF domain-containing protein [Dehalococcoidia bacterium]
MPPYLSLRDAATAVGVHHTTLSRAVKRGLLLPVARTPGGYPRFTAEAVQAYAAQLLTASSPATTEASRRRQLRGTVLLLASELRPEVVLQRLAEQARSLVQARYGALAVMEQDGAIREFYTVGFTKAQRTALGPLPQGRGLLGELFKENRTVRVASISRHPSSVGFPPNHPRMQSLLGVPILNQGRNIGNIYLTDKIGAAEFTAEDQELVEELAQYAAVAIRNAALYQQTQRRSERWTALQAIANRITLAMEPQAILRHVVLDARTLLGVDSAFISLLNPATGRLRTVTSSGLRRQRSQPPVTVTAGAGNIAIWGKTPLVIDDYASDDRFLPAYKQRIAAMGLVSLIVAPLEARGQALGALYLGTRRRRKFQPEEAELVGQLASLAAVVLDNARQYAAERAAHDRAEHAE